MKTILKSMLIVGLLFMGGCGAYYIPGEEVWVEEEVVVSHPIFTHNRLTFEVRWNPMFGDEEPIVKLIMPSGFWLEEGDEMDGCIVAETYDEDVDVRVATVDCLDPFHANYTLRLKNPDSFYRDVSVQRISEYDTHPGSSQQFSESDYYLFPGEVLEISYLY